MSVQEAYWFVTGTGARPGVIRVFVSSTFEDMARERDLFAREVFPGLRRECASRGLLFEDVDLRWGVTEEEGRDGKTMSRCLREARRSDVLIALLGERRGWLPSASELPDDAEPWLTSYRGASATELEVLCWLHHHSEQQGALFYVRSRAAIDSNELRRRFHGYDLRLPRSPRNYWEASELADFARRDLVTLLDERGPALPSSILAQDQLLQESIERALCHDHVAFGDILEALDRDVARGPTLLTGQTGGGKSSTLAAWAGRARAHVPRRGFGALLGRAAPRAARRVMVHFPSASPRALTVTGLWGRLAFDLAQGRELEPTALQDHLRMRETALSLLAELAAKQPVVLVLDDVDLIAAPGPALGWLPEVFPKGVSALASCSTSTTVDVLRARGWRIRELPFPTKAELREVLRARLDAGGKALSTEQEQALLAGGRPGSPQRLVTVIDELQVLGRFDSLDEQIDEYVALPSLEALMERRLDRLESEMSRQQLSKALALLVMARHGLPESELRELAGTHQPMSALDLTRLRDAFGPMIRDSAGYLMFANRELRGVAQTRYLAGPDVERRTRQEILSLQLRRPASLRKAEEALFQCRRLQDAPLLVQLLSDPELIRAAWPLLSSEVIAAWSWLERLGTARADATYREVSHRAGHQPEVVLAIAELLLALEKFHPACELFSKLAARFADVEPARALACLVRQALSERGLGLLNHPIQVLEDALLQSRGDASAELYAALGELLWERGAARDVERAFQLHEQEIALRKANHDVAGEAVARLHRERAHSTLADPKQSLGIVDGIVGHARACNQLGTLAGALALKGALLRKLGSTKRSSDCLEEAERLSRLLGRRQALLAIAIERAWLLQEQGDYDRAFEVLTDIGAECERRGDLLGQCRAQLARAGLYRNIGDIAGAERCEGLVQKLSAAHGLESMSLPLSALSR